MLLMGVGGERGETEGKGEIKLEVMRGEIKLKGGGTIKLEEIWGER